MVHCNHFFIIVHHEFTHHFEILIKLLTCHFVESNVHQYQIATKQNIAKAEFLYIYLVILKFQSNVEN